MKRHTISAVTIAAMVALLVPACGDDEDASSASTTEPPKTDATEGPGPGDTSSEPEAYDDGTSAERIVLGSVSSASGLTDLLDPRAASAYFAFRNSSGGINGRQVELRLYDDQFDPARNAALTRQAVEQDKVFAFTASMAPLSGQGAQAYLEEKMIPVIGGELVNLQTWGKSPMFYPQSILQSTDGARLAGQYAVDEVGCERVGALGSAQVAEADQWRVNFELGIKDRGLDGYVFSARPALAEPDYNVYVVQMKEADADCITMGSGMPFLGRLRKALAQQEYFPKLVLPSSAYDPSYVESTQGQPRENDWAFVQHDLFENASTNPAMQEFVDNVTRYEPDARHTGFALLAWTAAKLAADVLERMGDNLTRENLLETLDTTTDYDNGITPPLTFRPGPHRAAKCAPFIRMKADGTWRVAAESYCLQD